MEFNEELARKTAEEIGNEYGSVIALHYDSIGQSKVAKSSVDVMAAIALKHINEAARECREDILRLLSSTDETVALHSEFTAKYRGV